MCINSNVNMKLNKGMLYSRSMPSEENPLQSVGSCIITTAPEFAEKYSIPEFTKGIFMDYMGETQIHDAAFMGMGPSGHLFTMYRNGETWRPAHRNLITDDIKIYVANGRKPVVYQQNSRICTIQLKPNKCYILMGTTQIDKSGIDSIISSVVGAEGSNLDFFNLPLTNIASRTTTSNGGGCLSCLICKTGSSSAIAYLHGYGYFNISSVNYVGYMYAIEFPGDIQVFH